MYSDNWIITSNLEGRGYVWGCFSIYCNTIDHLLFCATVILPLRDLSCTLGMFGETTDSWITMCNPVNMEHIYVHLCNIIEACYDNTINHLLCCASWFKKSLLQMPYWTALLNTSPVFLLTLLGTSNSNIYI